MVWIQEGGDEVLKQKYKQLGEANLLNTLRNYNFVTRMWNGSDGRLKCNIYQYHDNETIRVERCITSQGLNGII